MRKTLRLSTVCLALLLSGCVTATWTRVEQSQMTGPDRAFTIEAPAGWVHAAYLKNQVFLTRDGPAVQFIRVMRTPHAEAFAVVNKDSAPDMLPSELAELVVAELKAGTSRIGLEVVESVPRQVAGHPGFRLHLRFRDERGLRYEIAVCGFAADEGFFTVLYHAPTLHYFRRDLPEFERVVASLRLGGT